MANILQDFLIRIGFQVNPTQQQRAQNGIQSTGKSILAVGAAAIGAASAVHSFASKTALNVASLYLTSQRLGSSSAHFLAMGAAAAKAGVDMGTLLSSMEALQQGLKLNPTGQLGYLQGMFPNNKQVQALKVGDSPAKYMSALASGSQQKIQEAGEDPYAKAAAIQSNTFAQEQMGINSPQVQYLMNYDKHFDADTLKVESKLDQKGLEKLGKSGVEYNFAEEQKEDVKTSRSANIMADVLDKGTALNNTLTESYQKMAPELVFAIKGVEGVGSAFKDLVKEIWPLVFATGTLGTTAVATSVGIISSMAPLLLVLGSAYALWRSWGGEFKSKEEIHEDSIGRVVHGGGSFIERHGVSDKEKADYIKKEKEGTLLSQNGKKTEDILGSMEASIKNASSSLIETYRKKTTPSTAETESPDINVLPSTVEPNIVVKPQEGSLGSAANDENFNNITQKLNNLLEENLKSTNEKAVTWLTDVIQKTIKRLTPKESTSAKPISIIQKLEDKVRQIGSSIRDTVITPANASETPWKVPASNTVGDTYNITSANEGLQDIGNSNITASLPDVVKTEPKTTHLHSTIEQRKNNITPLVSNSSVSTTQNDNTSNSVLNQVVNKVLDKVGDKIQIPDVKVSLPLSRTSDEKQKHIHSSLLGVREKQSALSSTVNDIDTLGDLTNNRNVGDITYDNGEDASNTNDIETNKPTTNLNDIAIDNSLDKQIIHNDVPVQHDNITKFGQAVDKLLYFLKNIVGVRGGAGTKGSGGGVLNEPSKPSETQAKEVEQEQTTESSKGEESEKKVDVNVEQPEYDNLTGKPKTLDQKLQDKKIGEIRDEEIKQAQEEVKANPKSETAQVKLKNLIDSNKRYDERKSKSQPEEEIKPVDKSKPSPVIDSGTSSVSQKYESGKSGTGTISTGAGDKGGVSYGKYQLASAGGSKSTLSRYLKDSGYDKQFQGMQINSPEFKAKWKDLAKNDENFGKSQHEFIKKTHYDPAAKHAAELGIDMSKRSMQEAVWSASVQHGKVNRVLDMAANTPGFAKMNEEQQVRALYKARGEYADQYANKSAGSGRYKREVEDVVALVGKTGEAPTQVAEKEPAVAKPVQVASNEQNGGNLGKLQLAYNDTTKQDSPRPEPTLRQIDTPNIHNLNNQSMNNTNDTNENHNANINNMYHHNYHIHGVNDPNAAADIIKQHQIRTEQARARNIQAGYV